MKKILNKTESVVWEMCNGIAMAHPELEFDQKYKIIKKRKINKSKVSLISGGGSGHEPAHAGFVGKGMLDAAVCGDVLHLHPRFRCTRQYARQHQKKEHSLSLKTTAEI